MAISSFLPLVTFISTYLMLLHTVSSTDALTFSFNEFNADQRDLIFQGDATVATNQRAIQLTRVDNRGNPLGGSVGRVLYSAPLRLWDTAGGRASFETSFVFVISRPGSATPADGLTFFIASDDSRIPPNSGGALLGLFGNANAINNTRNEFVGFNQTNNRVVAVEFDTYPNLNFGDPNFRHVGLNVNSIRSRITHRWNWQNGRRATGHISYSISDRTIRLTTAYPDGSYSGFSAVVDLATQLPQWVRVGFSAATGQYSQVNNVLSWTFVSNYRRRSVQEKEEEEKEKEHGYLASVV